MQPPLRKSLGLIVHPEEVPCGGKTSNDSLDSQKLTLVHDLKPCVRVSDIDAEVAVVVMGVHDFPSGLYQRQQQRDRVVPRRAA